MLIRFFVNVLIETNAKTSSHFIAGLIEKSLLSRGAISVNNNPNFRRGILTKEAKSQKLLSFVKMTETEVYP